MTDADELRALELMSLDGRTTRLRLACKQYPELCEAEIRNILRAARVDPEELVDSE